MEDITLNFMSRIMIMQDQIIQITGTKVGIAWLQ